MYFKCKIKLFKAIILQIEKEILEQIHRLVQRNKPREIFSCNCIYPFSVTVPLTFFQLTSAGEKCILEEDFSLKVNATNNGRGVGSKEKKESCVVK